MGPAHEVEADKRPAIRDSDLPSITSTPVAPETVRGRHIALGVALVLTFLAAAWIASPLWVGIMLGMVLAFTFQPLYRKLIARRFAGHPKIAAALVTLLSGFLAVVAGGVTLYVVARELIQLGTFIQARLASGSAVGMLGPRALTLLAHLHVDQTQAIERINAALASAQGKAMTAAGIILQATTGAALGLLIALITEYFMLLDWASFAVRLERVLPLDPRHTRALLLEFREVGRSAFVGTVATAIVQGVLGWIGFTIAGVNGAVTWGLLTGVASLLPVVGTFIVWVPIAGYKVWTGHVVSGIFLLAWGLLVVSIVADYFIRPLLVGKGRHGHPLLILVSLIGGIEVMGLAGLIVAPMLMSLFLAVLKIYEREPRSVGPAVPAGH
jgi:predicted PurR-regulated permease PerM